MNKEEEQFLVEQQQQIDNLRKQVQIGQISQQEQAIQVQQQERSMIKDQLDLGAELESIENLLRGKILRNGEWQEPVSNDMVILSEHGIQLIMNTISFYVNKNTLLSNYFEEDMILRKMEDFATDLADTIFMEYEKVFEYPSFEDCKEILEQRIKRKTDIRAYAYELVGKVPDKERIKESFINEIEERIDEEIEKIKQQIIKNKLKRFLILIRSIQDTVHSTYLRAYRGQERTTLRQHFHITENRGNMMQPQSSPSKLNPLNWRPSK